MGLCFSKKQRRGDRLSSEVKSGSGNRAGKDAAPAPEAKKAPSRKTPPRVAEEPTAGTRTVFVVKAAAAAAAAEVAAASGGEEDEGERAKSAPPEAEAKPVAVSRAPVRTSSCTKEEVDAILIQCGRLSRSSSSSGKAAAASGESGGGHRRPCSGSKRSYDFDRERRAGGGVDDECDWERQGAAASRPSPRRRTPERKRSGSHERSGGPGSGSRRVSRSPGRRGDGSQAAASSGSGDRAVKQPGKLVSVPPREKGRAASPVPVASGKRYPSPRSNSPARAAAMGNENVGGQPTHGPSLSRSSSRKAEQSPYRRNPMAELDENTLVHNNSNNGKSQKKSIDSAAAVPHKDQAPSCRTVKDKPEIVQEAAVASDTKAPPAKMNETHTVSIVADSAANPRAAPGGGRSSRRSSRDFDHTGNSYASLLLEDIQNYHQQSTGGGSTAAPSFSLPACVSKACSILEAVADLNSSASESRSFDLGLDHRSAANDKGSANGRHCGKAAASTLVVESEVVVEDDLVEPSLHMYVSVRDTRREAEPQESAGSNSFAGNAWTCSWEPNSVDSTGQTWTVSQSDDGDEVEQRSTGAASPPEQSLPSKQRPSSRVVGSTGNVLRGRSPHRGGVSVSARPTTVRAVSTSS